MKRLNEPTPCKQCGRESVLIPYCGKCRWSENGAKRRKPNNAPKRNAEAK